VGVDYLAARFKKIKKMLKLVFAFVNAPLFGTFLAGMFWKRATGHGAFVGLVSGTVAAAVHHGLSIPKGAVAGIKGGWLSIVHTYPSEMAQNFWTAIWAFSTCVVLTVTVSLLTRPRDDKELVGLVYSLTPRDVTKGEPWYMRPASLGLAVLVLTALFNLVFW